ncbi:MAG TPA: hypothetical protein VH518_06115 [Tepidisphaeraceae bacterium]|jgi:hypothetical protein
MAVDLICPDCGGIIGATSKSPDGREPCSCFNDRPSGRSNGASDPSDTVSIPTPVQGRDAADMVEKICISCGKNVAGHRRVKDSRGYLCYDCAKAEVRQEREGTTPCAECGRRVKEGGLINYGGIKICRKCHEDHRETQRKAVKKVTTHHFDVHEKKNLIILAVVFIVLAAIVIWRQFITH